MNSIFINIIVAGHYLRTNSSINEMQYNHMKANYFLELKEDLIVPQGPLYDISSKLITGLI